MARHIDDIIAELDDYVEETPNVESSNLGQLVKDLAEFVKAHDSSTTKHTTFIGTSGPTFGEKVAD